MRHSKWPIIKSLKRKNGTTWMVDCGMVNGKRPRFFFETKQEAQTKAELLRTERENEGMRAFNMTPAERDDALVALELLSPHQISLATAARFYLNNSDVVTAAKTVTEVIDELIAAKTQDGRSQRYLKDLEVRLGVFRRELGARPIHTLSTREVDDWLRRLNGGASNRNNYRRLLAVMFAYAAKRRYVLKNVVREIDVATEPNEKPGILTVEQARALLANAEPRIVPVIALGLFAGLRPESEIQRLDWSQINLEDRTIEVSKSKNLASDRFVTISDNLAEWLRKYQRPKGQVSPFRGTHFWKTMRPARDAAGITSWPTDVLRHSFASYHYGLYKDAPRLAEQLGHGQSLQMLFRHYRGRVKETEAKAYWEIRP
jgi:integrase